MTRNKICFWSQCHHPKNHRISKLVANGDPKEPCKKRNQPPLFLEGAGWFLGHDFFGGRKKTPEKKPANPICAPHFFAPLNVFFAIGMSGELVSSLCRFGKERNPFRRWSLAEGDAPQKKTHLICSIRFGNYTPWNIFAPENRPSSNHPFSRAMLVSWRVSNGNFLNALNSHLGTISEAEKIGRLKLAGNWGSNRFFFTEPKKPRPPTIFSRSESFATSRFGRSDLEHLW